MASDYFDLLDWKRRVSEVYRQVRLSPDARAAWQQWRAVRDDLFATHPQSPVPAAARRTFSGLWYFDYNPAARVLADVVAAPAQGYDVPTSDGSSYRFTRFSIASFEFAGRHLQLELYWLEGYGGGLFLPFRDATSGVQTYGAGRYLLDTVKGADLGTESARLVLDFNFAYSPSCAYDPQWVCPLAPPPNWLPLTIPAGERVPEG